jgi:thiazolylpeptide-type bacteriocin precursor
MNAAITTTDLSALAGELASLESETFEIQDYAEVSSLLSADASNSTSTSSTSTCSATTSTTSCA